MNHKKHKLESANILDELTAISHGPKNQLILKRLEKRAIKIMDVDQVGAYEVLGAISAFRFDVNKSKKYHKKVLELKKDYVNALSNYSVSLEHLYLFREAYEIASTAFEKRREDLELLNRTIQYAIRAGLFDQAMDYLRIWNRQNPSEINQNGYFLNSISSLIIDKNINQKSLQNALSIFYKILRDKKIYYHENLFTVYDDEIIFENILFESSKNIVNLNEKFAEEFLMADNITDSVKEHFTGIYCSHTEIL